MVFGYARVSTQGQARDGNSLEAQKAALAKEGCDYIFADAFTGTKTERPELDKLRMKIRKGDTLIVTKLDRLGRSVAQVSALISDLLDEGISIQVLDIGMISNDSMSVLFRNILLAFSQFERDLIVQRTQEGKAVAKATNPHYREGRPPKYNQAQYDHAMELLKSHSYTEVVKLTGISRATLLREAKRRKALEGV